MGSSLVEKLHNILARIRKSFGEQLMDPDELQFSETVEIMGRPVIAKSSVSLDQVPRESNIIVYLHMMPRDDDSGDGEFLRYFSYNAKRELNSISIRLTMKDGVLLQEVRMSTILRETATRLIEGMVGRGKRTEGMNQRRMKRRMMMRKMTANEPEERMERMRPMEPMEEVIEEVSDDGDME